MVIKLVKQFESTRPFTEPEAWLLFRIAAIAEACGWTILITGIVLKQYVMHGNNAPVLIAGQTHGMIFFAYLVAAVGLYPSLGWSRLQAVGALIFSVPPYGTLVFEWWAAHQRQKQKLREYRSFLTYSVLVNA